jgi:hypothetical protein
MVVHVILKMVRALVFLNILAVHVKKSIFVIAVLVKMVVLVILKMVHAFVLLVTLALHVKNVS